MLIESDDPRVMRDGSWTAQDTPSASGGSYLYVSGSPDDILTLEFEGPSVEIIYVKHPAFGTLAIEIDGVVVRTVITTAKETEFDARAVVNYLEAGPHVLRVYAADRTIAVDAFVAAVPLAQASTPLSVTTPCEAYTIVRTPTQLTQALSLVKPRQDSGQYCLPFTIYISDNNNQVYSFSSELQVSGYVFLKGFDENPTLSPVGKPPSANPVPDIILDSNSGSTTFGVMRITGGSTVVIRNLTITGGDNTTEYPSAEAENCGGGIRNYGNLTLLDSALIDNRADIGGAICNGGYPTYAATLTVERTVFERNVVVGDALNGTSGGGAIMNWRGQLSASCSRFDANRSGHMGAAIFNENTATASIANNRFLNNVITINPIPPSYGRDIHNRSATSTVKARYNRWTPGFHTYGDVLVYPTLMFDPTLHPDCQYAPPPPLPSPQPPPDICLVTLVSAATGQSQITQMATDMKAIAGTNGLYLHVAPAMNAPKVYVDGYTFETIPTGIQTTGLVSYIKWGDTVAINSVFIDNERQVWYGLEASPTSPDIGLDLRGINTVWMAAKVYDADANTENHYTYVNSGTIEDPCPDLESPHELTFPYDRRMARNYATEHGYNNRSPRGTGQINLRITSSRYGIPFADFQYSGITHISGATGSAAFISEALWIGGMPFVFSNVREVVDSGGDPSPSTCPNSLMVQNKGWFLCKSTSFTQGTANNVFINHHKIVAYYTSQRVPVPDNGLINDMFISTKGRSINVDSSGEDALRVFTRDEISVDGQGNVSYASNTGNNFLTDVDLLLDDIKAGDYMWVDSFGTSHGFLVVGWGPLLPCSAFETQQPPPQYDNNLSMDSGDVPYVVDFSHGRDSESGLTGETQIGIQRPFYCSIYLMPSSFGGTGWWFFIMPNQITLDLPETPPYDNRLFVQQSWVWDASAGGR